LREFLLTSFKNFASFFPENNNTVVKQLEMCKFPFLDCCNRASVDLQVQLGIMFKDENRGEDMVDILRSLHEWVPQASETGEEIFDRVPVVGDQKTMERGLEGQFSVSNAYTRGRRLEGLFFQLADWHLENKFLGVRIKLIFAHLTCNNLFFIWIYSVPGFTRIWPCSMV